MKKIILILMFMPLIVYAGTGGTKTVIENGTGNYTSLASWQAGEVGKLNQVAYAIISGSWTNVETSLFISGWTTYTTAYVLIQTQGQARHSGIWNDTAHRIVTDDQEPIGIDDKHVRLDGLQIESQRDASLWNSMGIRCYDTGSTSAHYISNCIIRYTNAGNPDDTNDISISLSVGSAVTSKVWNNIIQNFGLGISGGWGVAGRIDYIYNNTIINCDRVVGADSAGITIRDGAGDVELYLKNNIIQGTTKNYELTTFTVFITSNNISQDNTSPNSAYITLQPIFISSTNFHLVSVDTSAYQKGVNLVSDSDSGISFSIDIDSQTRPTIWAIGADDIPSAVSTRKRRCITNLFQ